MGGLVPQRDGEPVAFGGEVVQLLALGVELIDEPPDVGNHDDLPDHHQEGTDQRTDHGGPVLHTRDLGQEHQHEQGERREQRRLRNEHDERPPRAGTA